MPDRRSSSGSFDRQGAINDHFAQRIRTDLRVIGERLAAGLSGTGELKPSRPPVRVEGGRLDVRFAEIDNPYFSPQHREDRTNPRRVPAARNINESPLVRLEALGTIDAAQAAAGHRFRALVERLMSGRVSPSLVQERVDGQSAPDVFTEGRMRASFALADAAEGMTAAEFWAVHFVCGEGRSLNDLARAGRWRKAKARELLVSSLDRLAEIWDLRPANATSRR